MVSVLLCTMASAESFKLNELVASDPFIYADAKSRIYYMVKQAPTEIGERGGVEFYKSRNLVDWEGPVRVLDLPEDNWINGKIWAPELHRYKGKYYLFATINSDIEWRKAPDRWPRYTYRATQTFVSKNIEGPYKPLDKYGPVPPMDHMTLDGTLWIEDGIPYMVYCHEWVQVEDGTMEYVPMNRKLSAATDVPKVMFHSSAAKWSSGNSRAGKTVYITDGPCLYRSRTGELLMLWSSYIGKRYAMGVSRSVSGRLSGPWVHEDRDLCELDGGHGMIFKDFDGNTYISFHTFEDGIKRPHIFRIFDEGTTLRMGEEVK